MSRATPLVIRRALPGEADALTVLCRTAKRHWGYPTAWMDVWAVQLQITAQDIAEQFIYVGEADATIVGFYGLRRDEFGWHLEHLWLKPAHMGCGFGRELFEAAVAMARRLGARELHIKADPNAEPFYQKMGAVRRELEVYELLGTRREVPRMVYAIPEAPRARPAGPAKGSGGGDGAT
ncbi:MAG: GNAT family N-acetyltransferase [Opitutus sp.]|nr:GNAT family N-acetyltransferase [Opitutus sp.]